MNREERRRLKVGKGVNAVDIALIKKQAVDEVMKKIDVEGMKQEATRDAARIGFRLLLCIPVMVAHDKMGWGKKRLTRLTDWILDTYDAYEQGYITLDDLIDTLKEETGIDLEYEEE